MRPRFLSPPRPRLAPAEGVAKTELAAAHVRAVNPWVELATVDADLTSLTPGIFEGIDVAVLGLDNHRAVRPYWSLTYR